MGWSGLQNNRAFWQMPRARRIGLFLTMHSGIGNEALATIVAGIIGTLLVGGIAFAVAYTRRNRSATTG